MIMRRVLSIALASTATLGFASAANAGATLGPVNGPNLSTHIDASLENTQNNNVVVYGTTTSPTGQDVIFTANTPVHITGGSGFASISDVTTTDNTLFTMLTIDPAPNFTAYQFSVQLLTDSYILVQYLLAGANPATDWQTVPSNDPFFQNANTNKDYELDATGGSIFGAIRIATCSDAACTHVGGGIDFVKQESITLANVRSVPEPGTWGLMLLGFAGVGLAMRRSRKNKPALMQLA